jgi:hypothetical protein
MGYMSTPGDFNPAVMPPFPPTDESGEVDMTLIEAQLELTPSDRLSTLQSFVNDVLEIRRRRWGNDDPFSGILESIA